jgi:hypothetical protein
VIYRNLLWKGGGKDGKKSAKERLFVLVKDLPKPGQRTLRYYDAKKFGKELGQIALTQDGQVTKTAFDSKAKRHTLELTAVDKKNGARTFFFSTADEQVQKDWFFELKPFVGGEVMPAEEEPAEEEPAAEEEDEDLE